MAERDLWWFQPRAVKEVLEHWDSGNRKVCLVSPPGSGKTVMAGKILQQVKPKRAVAIVHTRGLKLDIGERLCETVTVQSVLAAGRIPGEPPDLVIYDECHHSAGAAWGTVFDIIPRKASVLGLTGTPQRADGKALDRFDTMVVGAHYSELLMARTIVPYRILFPSEFREEAEPDPAHAWRKYGENKKAIFYCRSVEQADDVARRLGRIAAPWHSQIQPFKKREESLKAFKAGDLRCLVTVDALTEGIDIPDSECIVLASPCHNVSTYLQKTGRGGRSAPGKVEGLLLDLSGAHLRHGSPTEDREYSIHGSGIARKTSPGGRGGDWYYEREKKELGAFNAELVVGYDWRHPTNEDKRKQLGWLVEFAGRRGWTRDVAESVFRTLFGEDPPQGAEVT